MQRKYWIYISTITVSTVLLAFLGTQDLNEIRIENNIVSPKQTNFQVEAGNSQNDPSYTTELVAGSINKTEIITANSDAAVQYLSEMNISTNYGVYFLDLSNPNYKFSHNEREEFAQANIYKIPLAMVTLKQIEENQLAANTMVVHKGSQKTILKVIEAMMISNDNSAITILENKLGGYNATQALFKKHFGEITISRTNHKATPLAIAAILQKLYVQQGSNSDADAHFLDEDNSNFLIKLMQSGDATIIFGQRSDYVLVILKKDRPLADATAETKVITNILLNGLE